jgi:transposase InsO family protein
MLDHDISQRRACRLVGVDPKTVRRDKPPDISHIWTNEGWLYLAVILDLHSRHVIGWAVSNRMKRDLAIRALDMAVALRRPAKGCIHHTDSDSQYCSNDDQKLLAKHGFEVSMSGKGNCYDNSMVETFFKSPSRDIATQYPASDQG